MNGFKVFGGLRTTTVAALCAGSFALAAAGCKSGDDAASGEKSSSAETGAEKSCGEKSCSAEKGAEKSCGEKSCSAK